MAHILMAEFAITHDDPRISLAPCRDNLSESEMAGNVEHVLV